MKKKSLLIKNQIYLATHQSGFWISSLILLGYVIMTFTYYGVTYYGFDAASPLAASEMYAFNGNAPYWSMITMVIPLLCAMNLGYQNSENRKNLTYWYVSLRGSAKEYWNSMMWANLILTFFQFEIVSLISMLLNRIAFSDTGVYFEGVRQSSVYVEYRMHYYYRMGDLHLYHPWFYNLFFSVIFSLFCAGMAHLFYGISLCIKKNGLWIFVIAAGVSYFLHQFYMIGDYDIWADVAVCVSFTQSGIPTIILWLCMIVFGTILIKWKGSRWEHEE